MGSLEERILDALQELGEDEFSAFKARLRHLDNLGGLKPVPWCELEKADRLETSRLIYQTYTSEHAPQVMGKVLEKIKRTDLRKRFPEICEGVELPSEDSADNDVKKPPAGPHGEASETLAPHQQLKMSLKTKSLRLFGWNLNEEDQGSSTSLKESFTEIYITTGGTGEVNNQHEVRQIEAMSRNSAEQETPIKCEDIFNPLTPENDPIRTVMTKGVAGIGKSILLQKNTLDWAEDKANQNTEFMFPFKFRELNSVTKKCSLEELMHDFFVETKGVPMCNFNNTNTMFTLDGLDEFKNPLNFKKSEIITDVKTQTTVAQLVINLIKGNLLPYARIWITSRPAAANQIPSMYVDRLTEVRGFTDPQKEEYFNNRFRDEKKQAETIISHIQSSRSLHIMCHIPVFCWIIAGVLENMLREKIALPKTLVEMFINFLLVHTTQKKVKFDTAQAPSDLNPGQAILSLGKLAFEQLERGNLNFSEKDLKECSIDTDAAVYSGVFTQFLKKEKLRTEKVFCFVHLSVQEFLAALYVHHSFMDTGVNLLSQSFRWSKLVTSKDIYFYQSAVDKATESQNGHLDLFLRFLLGLSLETNQKLIGELLPMKTRDMSKTNQKTIEYIKKTIRKNPSQEQSVNLFHCLNELNDRTLEEEIQHYVSSGSLSTAKVSPAQWSALVFILLSSGKELDVFDLKKYCASEEALLRMLPVVKASNRALLSGCNLTESCCEELSSAISSSSSTLTELDLSENDLQDSAVNQLCVGLESPQCKLTALRLSGCNLTERCCEQLSSVISSSSSTLTELDLSQNYLQDEGVQQLCVGLGSPHCKLKTLRLSGCMISEKGCSHLISALRSNAHLEVLDLSYNHPGDSVELLSALPLQTLSVEHSGENRLLPLKYSCQLSLDENTASNRLILSEENKKVTHTYQDQRRPEHKERFTSDPQVLSRESLPERSYFEVEWSGGVAIAVSYKDLSREGRSSEFGLNKKSWALDCDDSSYRFWHNSIKTALSGRPSTVGGRLGGVVGVYSDHTTGCVSFYSVGENSLTLLHTEKTTFTQPLYAGIFTVGTAEVCKIW